MGDTLDRVAALFEAALTRPPSEREAFLHEQCGADRALIDEVMALLEADDRAGGRIDRLVRDDLDETRSTPHRAPAELSLRPGDQVGRYEILGQLGEGGFAVVYLAQQDDAVRRRVALKILKPGMDTKEVLARFEAESKALALMDHPFIAKVFDAGATEQGRPYFAMQYVDGTPITEYCDEHRLNIKERLTLFIQLCEAVQHAHLKAVIHRDLKPSNVLVSVISDRPAPKVIDFGVAKAVEQKLTPDTIDTQQGALIGTPAYMSPEQVSDDSAGIDIRVDVYALGVVLFRLLAGKLPFERKRSETSGLSDLLRAICEDDPPRPSSLLKPGNPESMETARRRGTETHLLRRTLSGDLAWITLKALAKDRDRRYGSAKRLAEDIERYLANEPVLARPPSVVYRARKFVRRNAAGVVATSTAVLLLAVFAVTMAVQLERERQARAELARVVAYQANRLKSVDVQRMGADLRKQLLEEIRAVMERAGFDAAATDERSAVFERLLDGANFTNLASTALDEHIFKPALEAINEGFQDEPRIRARLLQRG